MANYIKVEDFGKGIDFESYVDQQTLTVYSPKEEEQRILEAKRKAGESKR